MSKTALNAPVYEQTVKLCVLAVEELTRYPEDAAEEHRYRRHTRAGLVGGLMFPVVKSPEGWRLQGARNSQGAALSASKWVKRAIDLKLCWREYDREGYGGIKITSRGVELAKKWIQETWAVAWLKAREKEHAQRMKAIDERRKRLRGRA